jgi:hypothetical protein
MSEGVSAPPHDTAIYPRIASSQSVKHETVDHDSVFTGRSPHL